MLLPAENEIVFVGMQEEGQPQLDVDALMDALVVALRSLPEAPGVSIDPTPAQLARGLRENDLMTVRYIGGDDRTVVGAAAFEADRLMKCLSFAKDNITKQPFMCKVPGYRSELDASLSAEGGADEGWHRFWIEQLESPVETSDDGRTLLLGARLGVLTEYMTVGAAGKLVGVKRPASGPAREFSDHLTNNYDAYAREFRAYQELKAYAQMTTLALALTGGSHAAAASRPAALFDVEPLTMRRSVRAVDTPETTPAIVASKQSVSTQGTTTRTRGVSLTGGVDLTPRPKYQGPTAAANQMQRDVVAAIARRPNAALWTVPSGRDTLVAVRRGVGASAPRIWQTDMVVGPLRFTRLSAEDGKPGSIGRDWRALLPELQFSADSVDVAQLGRMPRSATITTIDGDQVFMTQHGTLTMPGQPAVSGFLDTRRPKKRRLYRFRNAIVLEDGDVKYVELPGGSIQREVTGDAAFIEYDPVAPHRPQRIRTAQGTVEILWAGSRLLGYQADGGQRIDLVYGRDGGIVGLRGSDGQAVDYRFDGRGRLRAAAGRQGESIAYRLPDDDGRPTGIFAVFPDRPAGASIVHGPFEVSPASTRESLREEAARQSNATTVFIGLTDAPAGSSHDLDVVIGAREIPVDRNLERVVDAVLTAEKGKGPQSDWLRQTFLENEAVRGRNDVVVIGEPTMRNLTARALRLLAPDRVISTAANPRLAALNLPRLRGGSSRREFQHIHLAEGLDASINSAITELAKSAPQGGDLLIVSGHNSAQFQAGIEQLAASGALKGKTVVLLTCGLDKPAALDSLVAAAGAAEVIGFGQPIDARELEPLLREIYPRLRAAPDGAQKSIRRVLDDARQRRQLPNLIWQVGRRESRSMKDAA
jgi:hypothetical protein